MIHAGLCSLTLRDLSIEQIVEECARAGLSHIEWWGKGHVPMGSIDAAVQAGELTRRAGLQVSTYGSYYRVGESGEQGVDFEDVFETALALEAPAVRVWAGTKGSAQSSPQHRQAVIDEALIAADICAAADVKLVFEYHGGTLTDTNESAASLAEALQHPGIAFGWQTRTGASGDEKAASLRGMLPHLATLHVFNWTKDENGRNVRHPLGDATDEWRGYFDIVAVPDRNHVALIEFAKDDSVEQFREDAAVLRTLLNC